MRTLTASRVLTALAAAVALAGVVLMVGLVGAEALGLGLAWAAASVAVASIWTVLTRRPGRLALALFLIAACVFLAWVGGLFTLPAAFLLAVEALAGQPASAVAERRSAGEV